MPTVERFTGLGRPIDLRYSSNRYVAALTVVATAIGFAIGGVAGAVAIGGACFLGWATARELDPDHPLSAAIAGGVAGALAWMTGEQGAPVSLGTVYLLMAAARVLARTTGRWPTRIDLALHAGAAAWLSTGPHAWVAALTLAVAVVRDTRMSVPAPAENLLWGAAIGLFSAGMAAVSARPVVWAAPEPNMLALVVAGAVGLAVMATDRTVGSVTDSGKHPLDPSRVVAGRIVVGVGATVIALIGGRAGIGAVTPIWLALATTAAVRLARGIR